MKLAIVMSLSLAAWTGCDRAEGTQPRSDVPADTPTPAVPADNARENELDPARLNQGAKEGELDGTKPKEPDNTKVNERDRGASTLTPLDQGENETDRTITQKIRQAVVGSDALSTSAKNVKIITNGQVVTLRGPVKSEEEKAEIAAMAQRVEGVKRVDNQLEIAGD
jgi:hypothetical protein